MVKLLGDVDAFVPSTCATQNLDNGRIALLTVVDAFVSGQMARNKGQLGTINDAGNKDATLIWKHVKKTCVLDALFHSTNAMT